MPNRIFLKEVPRTGVIGPNPIVVTGAIDALQTGVKGDPGPQGIPGQPGPRGDTGDRGLPGAQGGTGPKGDTGAAGATGVIGAKGDTGLKGDPGLASAPVYALLSAGTTAMAFGTNTVVKTTPSATATFTTTVPPAGSSCTLIILTSGTTSRTITFGTGFKTTGTLATGTVTAKVFTLVFISDGTTLIQTSRSTAM